MSRLVRDLLLLARSDAGQLGRNRIELFVREVLERAVAGIRVAHPDRDIRLDIADESLTLVGNEEELVRLFTNVLDNAVRYTPSSGSIRVAAFAAPGNQIHIRVADTGIGIAPEHLPHLGERFYRVDPARTRSDGGTGLGLSICRGIVEAHGGMLTIASVPGEGTSVTVLLSCLF